MRRYAIVALFLALGFCAISILPECLGEGVPRVVFRKTVAHESGLLIDKGGMEVTKMWSSWQRRYDGYYVVGKYSEKGLVRADGTEILRSHADVITPFLKFGYACFGREMWLNGAVREDGTFVIINENGFRVLSNGSFYTRSNCLYDVNGKWLRSDVTVEIHNDFSEGLLSCGSFDEGVKTCVFVDGKGGTVFTHPYMKTGDFHDGMVWFEQDKLYGFMDKTGKVIMEPKFAWVGDFSEGLAAARVAPTDMCGYIGRDAKFVIEPQFQWGESFEQGTAVVELPFEGKPRKALIGQDGAAIDGQIFNAIGKFECGIAQVSAGDDRGAIDRRGKLLYPLQRRGEIKVGGVEGENCLEGGGNKKVSVVQRQCKYAIVSRDGREAWGLFNGNAGELLPPIYNVMAHLGGSMFYVQEGDSFFLYNAETGVKSASVKGRTYTKNYDCSATQGVFSYNVSSNEWGLVDFEGKVLLEPKFEELGRYHDGLAPAKHKNRWGYIDVTGKWVIPPMYKWVRSFMGGYAVAMLEDEIQLSDADGNVLLQAGYSEIRECREGRLAIRHLNYWGFLDKNLLVVVPPAYDEVTDYGGGIASVRKGDKWGALNLDGKLVLAIEHDEVAPVSNGRIPVKTKGKWGLADKAGKFVIPAVYDDIWRQLPNEGLVGICKDGKWGLVDLAGNMVLEPKWGYLEYLCKGYCIYSDGRFHQGGKFNPCGGIVSTDGRVVTEACYNRIQPFSDGYALVATSRWQWGDHYEYEVCSWNFVDETGKLLLEAAVPSALPFNNGLATVPAPNGNGFIDTSGKFISDERFDGVFWTGFADRSFACAMRDGKWGLLNRDMTWAAEPFADEIQAFVGQLALFKIRVDGKVRQGFINANGEVLYDNLEGAFILGGGIGYVRDAEGKVFAIGNNGKPLTESNYKRGCGAFDSVIAMQTEDEWHFLTDDGIFATAKVKRWSGHPMDVMILK